MKILIIVAVLFCAICVYSYYKEREKREAEEYSSSTEYVNKENDNNNQTKNETKNMKTKELLLEVLKKIGCQYEIDEEGSINFMWQGGKFSVA